MDIVNSEEIRKIKKNIQEFIKQGDGTHDKGIIVDDTVKETEHKIGLVVGDNDDDDSENLVIAEATVVECNSSSGNRKQVSFCFPGNEIDSGLEKSINDTEETVDIDTTTETNVMLETVGDSSNVETSTGGNTSCQYLDDTGC